MLTEKNSQSLNIINKKIDNKLVHDYDVEKNTHNESIWPMVVRHAKSLQGTQGQMKVYCNKT